ncbi:MAG TPA: hypothetical protein VGF67_30465, partial [Ktedonobacteraceae bacterium]
VGQIGWIGIPVQCPWHAVLASFHRFCSLNGDFLSLFSRLDSGNQTLSQSQLAWPNPADKKQ